MEASCAADRRGLEGSADRQAQRSDHPRSCFRTAARRDFGEGCCRLCTDRGRYAGDATMTRS